MLHPMLDIQNRAEWERSAYHEAGHAVCAVLIGIFLSRSFLSPDVNDDDAGTTFVKMPQADNEEEISKSVIYLLSGGFAEAKFVGKEYDSRGAYKDAQQAVALLRGYNVEQRRALTKRCAEAATTLLDSNWKAVESVAAELLKSISIGGDVVEKMVKRHTRRRKRT
jgi:ATP-dependent Zn protease